jgi:hypothetical protein
MVECEGRELDWVDLRFEWPTGEGPDYEKSSPWTEHDLYQIQLMSDAGLVQIRRKYDLYNEGYVLGLEFRLTNSGHDYLDAVRSDNIWQQTQTAVAETGGSAVLEIVKALAIGFAKKKVSQHTGIDL